MKNIKYEARQGKLWHALALAVVYFFLFLYFLYLANIINLRPLMQIINNWNFIKPKSFYTTNQKSETVN